MPTTARDIDVSLDKPQDLQPIVIAGILSEDGKIRNPNHRQLIYMSSWRVTDDTGNELDLEPISGMCLNNNQSLLPFCEVEISAKNDIEGDGVETDSMLIGLGVNAAGAKGPRGVVELSSDKYQKFYPGAYTGGEVYDMVTYQFSDWGALETMYATITIKVWFVGVGEQQ